MTAPSNRVDYALLGTGFYAVPEAARLLKTPARNINRWLGGYSYERDGEKTELPPLWKPQLPRDEDGRIELGFRDLIELRFVAAFIEAGLGLKTIRSCLEFARECVQDERPFSTRRFQTDGRTIFLDSLRRSGEAEVLDLKKKQYGFRQVIERSFKGLDIENDAVTRWRPFQGKKSIVIDPARSFGQPIVSRYGVPTVVLADAVKAEGSIEIVSKLYDVPVSVISDAVKFEQYLLAA
jgi:uncharacterized protein (DUF433 family)